MKKAIFFDVDDTLYDHLIPFRKAVWEWVENPGSFPFEKAYHRLRYYSDILSLELGGAGAMETGEATEWMRMERFRRALAEFDVRLSEEQAAKIQAAYLGCQYDIEMFNGARELIERLQASGKIVGLITNGAGGHQRRKIEAMELTKLVPQHRIFISGEAGWDKPDTRLFQHVNERTDTRPDECVYIGDSWRNDVIGALEAGWSVIWFNHRGQQPEEGHQPHDTATDFAELSRLLLP
ncbi:HAD family hydrolase [Paenibacillus nanensis]|uniref:HAD family hydrolase n=1 Tax=Paenibacillus nanensis TaxID=393251 RepID=A0A3A1VJC1_9BACL|nr:HAD family hydrolase [Paenibacillus nanensis]RIX60551.1 HAD family hydrolase [Paenibacillus nanensis]